MLEMYTHTERIVIPVSEAISTGGLAVRAFFFFFDSLLLVEGTMNIEMILKDFTYYVNG